MKKKSTSFTDSDIMIQAQPDPEIPVVEPIESHVSSTPTVQGYVFETKPVPKRAGKKDTLDYPINQLIPGSPVSFLVPATKDRIKQVTTSIRTFAYRNGFNVTLRPEDAGIRVWRAEPKPELTEATAYIKGRIKHGYKNTETCKAFCSEEHQG